MSPNAEESFLDNIVGHVRIPNAEEDAAKNNRLVSFKEDPEGFRVGILHFLKKPGFDWFDVHASRKETEESLLMKDRGHISYLQPYAQNRTAPA